MSIYASILKTAEVREALKRRECRHKDKHLITKGTKLLIIHVPNIYGAAKEMGYCSDCAAVIFDQAHKDLLKLEQELGLRRSPSQA